MSYSNSNTYSRFLRLIFKWKTKISHSSNKTVKSLEKISDFSEFSISLQRLKLKTWKPRKFQVPQTKQFYYFTSLEKFPSFPSFRFQYKDQNRKLQNLGNLQIPPTKQIHLTLQVRDNFRVFRVFDFIIRAKIENSETSKIAISSNKAI